MVDWCDYAGQPSCIGKAARNMIRLFPAHRAVLLGAFVVFAFSPSAGFAQSSETVQLLNRIERLERDIRTLNVQIARNGGQPVQVGSSAGATGGAGSGGDPAYARLSVRLTELEEQLRNMNGRIEEIGFQVTQATQQMEKMSTDIDYRLGQLEQRNSGAAAPMNGQASPMASGEAMGTATPTPPPSTPAGSGRVLGQLSANDPVPPGPATPSEGSSSGGTSEADALLAQLTGEPAAAPAATPETAPASAASAPASQQTAALTSGSPRDQYSQAFGLLRQGQYDQAAVALRKFLEENGDDPLAANARYWLGETYYVRGSYVEAAETFLEGYQADPKGAKAPDALLKLGMSLSSLEKKSEACAAFQKLRTDYPSAPAGLKATLQREWQKNGCV